MKIKVTNKMQLKHNLWPKASTINIVPNLHSTWAVYQRWQIQTTLQYLIKMKPEYTMQLLLLHPHQRLPPLCTALPGHGTVETWPGLWSPRPRIPWAVHCGCLQSKHHFNLPKTQQSLLYHHPLAGFPPKETFLATVRAENYATWPSLTTTLILKHFPNLDKLQKGHMKGQQKGVRST